MVDWNSVPLGQQVLKILPQSHSTQRARELGYLCTKGFTAPGETPSRILCLLSSTAGSGNMKALFGKGRLGLQLEAGQVDRVIRLRGCRTCTDHIATVIAHLQEIYGGGGITGTHTLT